MKRVVFVALSVAFFVACNSSDNGAAKTEPARHDLIGTNLVYDASVPVNDGKPISITFWTQVDQEEIYRDMIAAYTRIHPNVNVEIVSGSFNDHFNRLQIALQSGIGPDMFHMHNQYSETLIPHMAPYPNDILPLDALEKDFRQVQSHILDGKVYFIDTGLMTSCIYYNRKDWQAAGLAEGDIPKTWTELREVARKLTAYNGSGKILRSGFNPNGIAFALFCAINLQRGQRLFASADDKRPLVATSFSAETLGFIRDLYARDRVADVSFPEFHESFGRGESSMIYAWGWTNNWLRKNYPDLDFGTFPTPTWDKGIPPAYDRNNGESSMGVSAYARKDRQTVAFDMIKFFLANDGYLMRISLEFGVAPSKRSLDGAPALAKDPLMVNFNKILDRTVWPGALPSFYEEILNDKLIDPVIIDGKSVSSALAATQAFLNPMFGTNSFQSRESQYRFSTDFTTVR